MAQQTNDQVITLRAGVDLAQVQKQTDALSRQIMGYAQEIKAGNERTVKEISKLVILETNKQQQAQARAEVKATQQKAENYKRLVQEETAARLAAEERILQAKLDSGRITRSQFREEMGELETRLARFKQSANAGIDGGASREIGRIGRSSNAANMFLVDLSRGLDDLRYGIPAVINNLDPLALSFGRTKEQADQLTASTGKNVGVMRLLFSTLGTTGGVLAISVLAVNILALTGAAEKLGEMFEGVIGKAKRTRDRIKEISDEIINFQLQAEKPLGVRDADELRLTISLLEEQKERLEESKSLAKDTFALFSDSRSTALDAINPKLEATTRLLKKAKESLEEAELTEQVDFAVGTSGVRNILSPEEEAEAARKAAEKAASERERAIRQFRDLEAQLSIESIEEGQARELAEVEATYRERLALARKAGGDTAAIDAAYARERLAVERQYLAQAAEAEAAYSAALAEIEDQRLRIQGATETAILERKLARQREALAAAEAGSEEERALILEVQRAEVVLDAERARIAKERTARMEQLAADRRRLEGELAQSELEGAQADRLATMQDGLDRELLAIRQQLDARAVAIRRAAELERSEILSTEQDAAARTESLAQLELRTTLEMEEAKRAAARATTDAIDAEYDRRRDMVAGYAEDVFTVLLTSARRERELSDTDIRLEKLRFEEREDRLEESYRDGRISAERYHADVAALAEQRADFEQRVEEDRRGFIETAARDLTSYLIEQGARYLAAKAAQAVADLLIGNAAAAAAQATMGATLASITAQAVPAATLVSTATLGGAAAAGTAGIVAALAAVAAASAGFSGAGLTAAKGDQLLAAGRMVGFSGGGYTGALPVDAVAGLVHGGEVVMESGIVSGQVGDWMRLRRVVQQGVTVADLLESAGIPGYDVGGYVSSVMAAPSVQVVRAPRGRSGEVAGLARQVERLVDEVARMKQSPPAFHATPSEQRRANRAAADDASATLPRRKLGRPGRGS